MAEARAMDGLLHTIKNVALQTDDCTVPPTRYPGPHPARTLALVSVSLHTWCVSAQINSEFGESDRRRSRHSHDPFTGCPAPPLSLPDTHGPPALLPQSRVLTCMVWAEGKGRCVLVNGSLLDDVNSTVHSFNI